MKRPSNNSIILSFFFLVAVFTAYIFVFYIHRYCPRDFYDDSVILTMKVSLFLCFVFIMLNRFVGRHMYGGRKNWDNVINELDVKNMNFYEWVFLVTYVVSGFFLSTMGVPWVLGLYGKFLGL